MSWSMTCDMNNLYCGILARNNASVLLKSMAYYYNSLEGSHGSIRSTRRVSTHPGSTLHIQPLKQWLVMWYCKGSITWMAQRSYKYLQTLKLHNSNKLCYHISYSHFIISRPFSTAGEQKFYNLTMTMFICSVQWSMIL